MRIHLLKSQNGIVIYGCFLDYNDAIKYKADGNYIIESIDVIGSFKQEELKKVIQKTRSCLRDLVKSEDNEKQKVIYKYLLSICDYDL